MAVMITWSLAAARSAPRSRASAGVPDLLEAGKKRLAGETASERRPSDCGDNEPRMLIPSVLRRQLTAGTCDF
jgi:hypothetical protein